MTFSCVSSLQISFKCFLYWAVTMLNVWTTPLIYSLLVLFGVQPSFQQYQRYELKCDKDIPATTTISRLRTKLLCHGYDVNRPAYFGNETVDLSIRLRVLRFKFDEKTDNLEIHSWLRVGWHDFRLKWDAANYDNVDIMRVVSYYLWKPDLGDYTAADTGQVSTFVRPVMCLVYSDGYVICVPPYIHTTSCSADLTLWPYDSHTCNLEIGLFYHEEDKIRITEVDLDLSLNNPNVNREWTVTSTSSSIESKKIPSFADVYSIAVYTFVIKRQPRSFAATVVLPAVVLMLVTLITYWMEASESERLILAAVNVVCHFGFLMHLGRVLPSNGDKTPLIVTFYRDSMFLATMAVFTAAIVRGLKTVSVVLPIWASALSRWVVQTRVGQVLIFHNSNQNVNTSASVSDGTAVDNGTNASLPDWDAFLSVFNFLSFVVTLFTYFVLLVGFIP